jgi:putative hydroxymethylpyrimidine transport system permease protein
MVFISPITYWVLPLLIISQAVPTFAIAPLLVIWLGYGMASKIAVTVMMLFFPITSAFFDGLRRTPSHWLALAKTMNAKKWRLFWYIRIPRALPELATGIRVATAIAPIGAIVGEWVGASQGLGFLMLNANARMQIDLMFAVLFTIIIFSLVLYYVVDHLLRSAIRWH